MRGWTALTLAAESMIAIEDRRNDYESMAAGCLFPIACAKSFDRNSRYLDAFHS
jgi:hypothetical protein